MQAISDWLSPLDFVSKHGDICDRRCEGTGTWLFDKELFRDWLDSKFQVLWCIGARMGPLRLLSNHC